MNAPSAVDRAPGPSVRPVVFSASTGGGLGATLDDLVAGAKAGRIWRAFAWEETKKRYRRTFFGVAWIAVSYAFFVAALALFFGGEKAAGAENLHATAYIAIGLAAFNFLSSAMTDGATVFTGSANWINSVSLPYSVYIYKSVVRSLVPFALQLFVFFAFAAVFGFTFRPIAFLSLAALPIYLVNAVALHMALGYLTARFRDVEHLIGTILRVLFFVTPILWFYEDLTDFRLTIATINPMTHFIEIFRAPLLGKAPTTLNWIHVGLSTACLWAMALATSAVFRRRLPLLV